MADLRDQLQRNLDAMARELSRDPVADQTEWTRHVEEVFGCSEARIVTVSLASDQFGPGTSCDKTELGPAVRKKRHSDVPQNVTGESDDRRNLAN